MGNFRPGLFGELRKLHREGYGSAALVKVTGLIHIQTADGGSRVPEEYQIVALFIR